MESITTILAIVVLLAVAYSDIRRRLIPNELAIAIAVLGLVRLLFAAEPMAALWTLTAAAVVLLIGFVCFARGWVGAGDVKLLAAVVLLVGYREVPDLLLIMSLTGGLIAFMVLAVQALRPLLVPVPVVLALCRAPLHFVAGLEQKLGRILPSVFVSPTAGAQGATASPSVPYGVAIAAAAVTVLESSILG